MALITLNNLRTPAHQGQVFECPHWKLCAGQRWLVLGGNGAGKTLLANILAGRQALARGSCEYGDGFRPTDDLALVSFERQYELYDRDDRFDDSELREDVNDRGTTVAGFLQTVGGLADEGRELLKKLGLTVNPASGLRELSTGQIRKLMLVQALLARPRVLILDEPLAGLDAATRASFGAVLGELFARVETVLLLSGRVDELPAGASHIMHLECGRVVSAEPWSEQGLAVVRQQLQKHLRHSAPAWDKLDTQGSTQASGVSDSAQEPALIELHDVAVSFAAQPVFSGLSWTMQPCHHSLIVGPNGCGKSTLLNMLLGDNEKAYGQAVSLFGRRKGSGESVWDIKRRFGVVNVNLQRQISRREPVLHTIASGLHDSLGLFQMPTATERSQARVWFQRMGLPDDLAVRRFGQLSFGQQKLVLIARAMIKQPRILILDEPCLGLDDANRRKVLQVVNRIAATGTTQLLFVSHDQSECPDCINQRLNFVFDATLGCYRVTVSG